MSKMNLNELRDKAYKTACEHGVHDQELSNNHFLCLVMFCSIKSFLLIISIQLSSIIFLQYSPKKQRLQEYH